MASKLVGFCVKRISEPILGEKQGGFRRERGHVNQIVTLRWWSMFKISAYSNYELRKLLYMILNWEVLL